MAKRDQLSDKDMSGFSGPLLVPGRAYLWVQGFGWGIIGFYIRHQTAMTIRIAHANFFRNAGVDYGRIAHEGLPENAEWRYIGNSELTTLHILRTDEYLGTVKREPPKLA